MVGEFLLDEIDDRLDVPAATRRGHVGRADVTRQLLAIVCVETPAPARRLTVVLDQDVESLPLLPVKIGHQQARLARCKPGEPVARTGKHRRRQLLALDAFRVGEFDDLLLQRLVFDLEMHEPLRAMLFQGRGELLGIGPGIAGIQRQVMHVVTGLAQLIGISAHRRKEQHDLLLVVSLIGTEPDVLGHEDGHRARWRQVSQPEQLVTQDDQHTAMNRAQAAGDQPETRMNRIEKQATAVATKRMER